MNTPVWVWLFFKQKNRLKREWDCFFFFMALSFRIWGHISSHPLLNLFYSETIHDYAIKHIKMFHFIGTLVMPNLWFIMPHWPGQYLWADNCLSQFDLAESESRSLTFFHLAGLHMLHFYLGQKQQEHKNNRNSLLIF